MICSRCGKQTAERKRCQECGAPPLLGDRYRFDKVIGQGSSGVTYRATHLPDGRQVCVKELLYRRMDSFKDEELFHREAAVLKQLHHRAIPEYLDEFSEGEGKTYGLYLVQEFVDGKNLREEMTTRRYREEEVLEILLDLVPILEYLHDLRPPVVHRDIKPSNVMRRRSDGKLVLVDFGSVKKSLADATVGGTTVAGTFGYMAPEQLYGKAEPVSDLYALGVLGLVLLTGRQPDGLLDDEQRLEWKRHLKASKATISVLENLLERDPKRRARKTRRLEHQLRRAREELHKPPPKPKPRRERKAKPTPKQSGWPKPPKSESKNRGWLVALVPIIIVASVGGYSYFRSKHWSGDNTFSCSRDTERTFEEKTVDLTRTVIYARGRCRLTLVKCNFRTRAGSTATISASGHARVRIVGGRIEGGTYAVKATADATVVLENVTIEGKPSALNLGRHRGALFASDRAQIIVRGGSVRDPERAAFVRDKAILAHQNVAFHGETSTYYGGRIIKAKPGVDPEKAVVAERQRQRQEHLAREAKYYRYAEHGCHGIADCYRKHGAKGYTVGRLTMTVGSEGLVVRFRLHAPSASPPTLACLEALANGRRIPDFNERRGTITCAFSGDPAKPGRGFGVKKSFRAQ